MAQAAKREGHDDMPDGAGQRDDDNMALANARKPCPLLDRENATRQHVIGDDAICERHGRPRRRRVSVEENRIENAHAVTLFLQTARGSFSNGCELRS